MPRAKTGIVRRRRHQKLLKRAKGFWALRSKSFRIAQQTLLNAADYAYRDRRQKKRDFRKLWIARINAAARLNGLSYNRFISGLKKVDVDINRKMLAELAVNDKEAFRNLAEMAKSANETTG